MIYTWVIMDSPFSHTKLNSARNNSHDLHIHSLILFIFLGLGQNRMTLWLMKPSGLQIRLVSIHKKHIFVAIFCSQVKRDPPSSIPITALSLYQVKRDPKGFQCYWFVIVSSQKGPDPISVTDLSLYETERDQTGFLLLVSLSLYQAKRDMTRFLLLVFHCIQPKGT